jgi:hypothetical protein
MRWMKNPWKMATTISVGARSRAASRRSSRIRRSADFPAAAVRLQPVDQEILLWPVFTAQVEQRRAVAGGFGESAVAGFGKHRVYRTQDIGDR